MSNLASSKLRSSSHQAPLKLNELPALIPAERMRHQRILWFSNYAASQFSIQTTLQLNNSTTQKLKNSTTQQL